MDNKVWFITGCSTGFGRELAKAVLERGYRAVVTARNPAKVEDIVAGHQDRALVLEVDVTDGVEVDAAVKSAEQHFKRIDVLVNNAGIGYFGAVEESDEEEVRRMFEINFFGLSRMTRTVLPIMRAQRSGHIVNISSIGGLRSFPALAYYHATKYAVEGFSESLALEVAPLGIKVTIVEPSGFRTDWAGRSAAESKTRIADYATTAGKNLENLRDRSGKQPGDPVRAAAAIIAAVESPEPPLRLLLGRAALRGARAKLDMLKKDFDAWETTTVGADFPEGK
jgi:NAD(P)-dependent dehydrogenase (short-subunit alcohol dehydrogenase family)